VSARLVLAVLQVHTPLRKKQSKSRGKEPKTMAPNSTSTVETVGFMSVAHTAKIHIRQKDKIVLGI
jgi:hypothetical protein